jgi:hypothetical protein
VTGDRGVMLVREGRYAVALLPGTAPKRVGPWTVGGEPPVVAGDVLPGGAAAMVLDLLLLGAGVIPPGLAIGAAERA